ncbi:MAG: MoaD/ThiS family protein [Myxococcales bacterium]|nr:MoaD/ThiS family protein [Myxococcales bacterium]
MLAFAGARDVVGADDVEFVLEEPCSAAELLGLICARFPALAPHKGSLRIAINGAYAGADDPVRPGDEVALIPPVCGG